MKYTGRFVSLLIVAISSLGAIFHNYIAHDRWDITLIIVSVFYMFLGWWLGKQYDKVKYLSEKDLLTDSYNRRFISEIFPKLKSLMDRKTQKLFIVLIDVDDFKSINDRYDHEMGDRVLQMISQTLKHAFRESDYVVRWGGDELLVIVPCADDSGMRELLNRMHNVLNALSNFISIDVSVSVGYAAYPDDGIILNDLIKVADRKLYSDKRGKIDGKKGDKR